ncbi:MAG: hypothetical protein JW959_11115 [Pirellulales bacterium]|nr:hypothetical protein [Pirellulales bacterium]
MNSHAKNDALEAVLLVVAALRRLGVKYYLCGSLAGTFYGIARSTAGVDLVADLLEKARRKAETDSR